jgi:hypothetical protein
MEWVALGVWILVAALALPVAGGLLSGIPGLGLQVVAAIGGLGLCIVFIAVGGAAWAGWIAFGLACLGIVVDTNGASSLLSENRSISGGLQGAEELEAGLLGAQLPLFGVAALTSLAMAVELATVA